MAIEQCLKVENTVLDYGGLSEPGRSYTREFNLRNDCDHTINVSGMVNVYSGDGATANTDASKWVNFVGGESNFELAANGSKDVAIRVYVPEDAKPGSYYASVDMKNESSEQHDEEFPDAVKMTARMDILGAGTNFSGVLDSNYAMPISFGGRVASGAKLRNTGSVGYQVGYKLEKSNAFGLENFESLIDKNAELPAGGELELSAKELTENQYGIYKLRQTVGYVNSDGQRMESVLTQTVVNLPWVSVFIAGGCLFALILLLVVAKAIKLSKKAKQEDAEAEGRLEDEIEAEREEDRVMLERAEDRFADMEEEAPTKKPAKSKKLSRNEKKLAKEEKKLAKAHETLAKAEKKLAKSKK